MELRNEPTHQVIRSHKCWWSAELPTEAKGPVPKLWRRRKTKEKWSDEVVMRVPMPRALENGEKASAEVPADAFASVPSPCSQRTKREEPRKESADAPHRS